MWLLVLTSDSPSSDWLNIDVAIVWSRWSISWEVSRRHVIFTARMPQPAKRRAQVANHLASSKSLSSFGSEQNAAGHGFCQSPLAAPITDARKRSGWRETEPECRIMLFRCALAQRALFHLPRAPPKLKVRSSYQLPADRA